MVQLSLAAGINASSPQGYQLEPHPASGNPASGFGTTPGAFNPVREGDAKNAPDGAKIASDFQFTLRPGRLGYNSLLPFTQQIALNQSVFDTTYNLFGSSVDLNTWQQYAGIDGFYLLSTTVNNLVLGTLPAGVVVPKHPSIGGPNRQRGDDGAIYGVRNDGTPLGSQAGQTFPGDGLIKR
jgi:hypothetical protein